MATPIEAWLRPLLCFFIWGFFLGGGRRRRRRDFIVVAAVVVVVVVVVVEREAKCCAICHVDRRRCCDADGITSGDEFDGIWIYPVENNSSNNSSSNNNSNEKEMKKDIGQRCHFILKIQIQSTHSNRRRARPQIDPINK